MLDSRDIDRTRGRVTSSLERETRDAILMVVPLYHNLPPQDKPTSPSLLTLATLDGFLQHIR